jgi:hypothetical protein
LAVRVNAPSMVAGPLPDTKPTGEEIVRGDRGFLKRGRTRGLLVAVLLVGAGLACGVIPGLRRSDEPTNVVGSATEPGTERSSTAAPTASAAADRSEGISGTIDLNSLADFQFPFNVDAYHATYRQSVVTNVDEGERIVEGDVSSEPPASAMTRKLSGASSGGEVSVDDLRVIDGLGYMQAGDLCVMTDPSPLSPESMPPTAHLPEPADFLTGEAALIERGVMMNGRLTDHYGLDLDNFREGELVVPKMESLDRGDIYVDSEDGFLVDLQFEGRGVNDVIMITARHPEMEGEVTYQLSFTDFEQPTDIEGFESCGPVPQTDYPVIDRPILTYQLSPESFSLTVVADLDEVVQYYKVALAEDGWTLVEERAFDPMDLSLTFEGNEGKTLDVGIRNDAPSTAAPEDGLITITLFELDFSF